MAEKITEIGAGWRACYQGGSILEIQRHNTKQDKWEQFLTVILDETHMAHFLEVGVHQGQKVLFFTPKGEHEDLPFQGETSYWTEKEHLKAVKVVEAIREAGI